MNAPKAPLEEIRLAVVLNGGVSLAVWMGGVAVELDRLAHHQGVYGTLLDLAGCTARVDVIAGTSAGGINGAALALAQANDEARLTDLRRVWTDNGRLETLLRQPFTGSPTSLLRGDEYFLPQLNEAMVGLAQRVGPPPDRAGRPIDLTITTTLLRGAQKVTVDSTGQQLPQWVHDGRFHFQGVPGSGKPDAFAAENLPRTACKLALAARCTASFPVAFEPSFVPVDGPDARSSAGDVDRPDAGSSAGEGVVLRPDMGDVASWAARNRDEPGWITQVADGQAPPEASRFVVDGGLLANMPTRSALQGIERMPAGNLPVRRVMVLVHPHAPSPEADRADEQATTPTTTATVAGLLGALSAQGSRTFVEQIEAHNLAAAGRRGTRSDILRAAVEDPRPEPDALRTLAGEVYPTYRRLRMWRAGRDVARWVVRGEMWNQERVRRNSVQAQEAWYDREKYLPYVPALPPMSGGDPYGTARPGGEGWGWGVSVAAGVAEAATDMLRRLLLVLPPEPENDSAFMVVSAARKRISELRTTIIGYRNLTDDIWRTETVLTKLDPTEELFALRLEWYRWAMLGDVDGARNRILTGIRDVVSDQSHQDELKALLLDEGPKVKSVGSRPALAPAEAGMKVRDSIDEVILTLERPLEVLHSSTTVGQPVTDQPKELSYWSAIAPATDQPDWQLLLLDQLIALEVATTALGDEVTTEATGPVELVQLSAQVKNGFSAHTRTADDKLGGMALNRFGGLLKRSWRVNDWMWGRLDAATVLCRLVLDPTRLRRAAALRGQLADTEKEAETTADAEVRELLRSLVGPSVDPAIRALIGPAVRELTDVLNSRKPVDNLPPTLPNLAKLAAWAIHLQVAADELPALARAIRADRIEGANPRSNGERFLAEFNATTRGDGDLFTRLEGLTRDPGDLVPPEAQHDAMVGLLAFDGARIGQESLAEEGSSDQMLRTAATAAAVAVTTLDSGNAGLPVAAKAVTRTLRGGMLLPYWVVTGLTAGGALARALALLGLAVGAVLLALAVFGTLPGWAAGFGAAFGVSALLLGLGYGALRTGTLLHGVVLLSPIIPLLVFAASRAPTGDQAPEQAGIATLLAVLALAVGLMILGSLPAPMGSVFAELDRLADRQGVQPITSGATGWGRGLAQARRRARALARAILAPTVVGLALLGTVAVILSLVRSGRLESVTAVMTSWPWWVVAVGAGAAVLLGAVVAYLGGLSLRRLRIDPISKEPLPQPVAHPTGVALGWSVLYGVGYLVVVELMLWNPWHWQWQTTAWAGAVFATAVAFAITLLLVVPVVAPRLAQRRIVKRLAEVLRGTTVSPPPTTPDGRLRLTGREKALGPSSMKGDALIAELIARDQAYTFLVKPAVRPRPAPQQAGPGD